MPPKVRIRKEDIVKIATDLVREEGEGAFCARKIAERLSSSTQPIFSNFPTMTDLFLAVHKEALGIYGEYVEREIASGKYPPYKASGMAYIRFAGEEKNLFKLLYMRERGGEEMPSEKESFDASALAVGKALGFDEETSRLFHLEVWSSVHGIAVMRATGFLDLTEELISSMISDIYLGLRARYAERRKTDAGN